MDKNSGSADSRQLEGRTTGSLASTDLFPSPPHRSPPPSSKLPSSAPQSLAPPPLPTPQGLSPIVEYGIAVGARHSQDSSIVLPLAANARSKEARRQGLKNDTSSFVLQPAPRRKRTPPSRPPPPSQSAVRRQPSLDSSEALDHSVVSVTDTSASTGSKVPSHTTRATSIASVGVDEGGNQLDRGRFLRQQQGEDSNGPSSGKEDDEKWEGWKPRKRTSRRSTRDEIEPSSDSARIHLRADSAAETLRQMMAGPTSAFTIPPSALAPRPAPNAPSSPLVPILPLFSDSNARSTGTPQSSSSLFHHNHILSSSRDLSTTAEPSSTLRSGWDDEKETRRARKARAKAEKAEVKAQSRRTKVDAQLQRTLSKDARSSSVELPTIETLLGGDDGRFSLTTVLQELEAAQDRVARGDSNQARLSPTRDEAARPAHLAIASDVARRARNLFASRERSKEQHPRGRGLLRRWFGATSTPSPPDPSTPPPSSGVSPRYQTSTSSTRRPANRLRKPKPPPTQVCESGRSRSRRPPSPPSSLPAKPPKLSLDLFKHGVGDGELTPPFEEVLRVRPRSQALPDPSPPSLLAALPPPISPQASFSAPIRCSPPPSRFNLDFLVDHRLRSKRAARRARGDGEIRAALVTSWLEGVAGSEEEEAESILAPSPRATVLGLFASQKEEEEQVVWRAPQEGSSSAEAAAPSSTPAVILVDESGLLELHTPVSHPQAPPCTPSSFHPPSPNLVDSVSTAPRLYFAEGPSSLDLPRTPSLLPHSSNGTSIPSSPRMGELEESMPSTPPRATSTLGRQTSLRGRVSPFPITPIPINSRSSSPSQPITTSRPPPPGDPQQPSARRNADRSVTFADEPTFERTKTQSSSSSGFTSSSSADAHLFIDRSLLPRRPPRTPSDIPFPSSTSPTRAPIKLILDLTTFPNALRFILSRLRSSEGLPRSFELRRSTLARNSRQRRSQRRKHTKCYSEQV